MPWPAACTRTAGNCVQCIARFSVVHGMPPSQEDIQAALLTPGLPLDVQNVIEELALALDIERHVGVVVRAVELEIRRHVSLHVPQQCSTAARLFP